MKIWMNIYHSGFYHRAGKANTLDCHGGDCYTSPEAAIRAIHPVSHYITTVGPIEMEGVEMAANPKGSLPVPLSVSRKAFFKAHEHEEIVHG